MLPQGVIRFRFKDYASDRKEEFFEWSKELGRDTKRFGPSPAERQRLFLAELHKQGYEPFDGDEDGYQYWRKPNR